MKENEIENLFVVSGGELPSIMTLISHAIMPVGRCKWQPQWSNLLHRNTALLCDEFLERLPRTIDLNALGGAGLAILDEFTPVHLLHPVSRKRSG